MNANVSATAGHTGWAQLRWPPCWVVIFSPRRTKGKQGHRRWHGHIELRTTSVERTDGMRDAP